MSSDHTIEMGRTEVGFRHYPVATIGLTILASIAGTAYLHEGSGDHNWRVEYENPLAVAHIDTETRPIGPGHPEMRKTQVQTPGSELTRSSIKFDTAASPYARDYANDAVANEVDQNTITRLDEVLPSLRSDGWTNITLYIQGKASAEDDLTLSDAGLTTPSERNKELADARRDALIKALSQDDKLPDGVDIQAEAAYEGALSPSQVITLATMADTFGYQNISHMIDSWNTGPENVPQSVADTLDKWLGADRGDTITVLLERSVATTGQTQEVEQAVCVIPTLETITTHKQHKPGHFPIPEFMIIPIPAVLPIIRRRRSGLIDNPFTDYERRTRLQWLEQQGLTGKTARSSTPVAMQTGRGAVGGVAASTVPETSVPPETVVPEAEPDLH